MISSDLHKFCELSNREIFFHTSKGLTNPFSLPASFLPPSPPRLPAIPITCQKSQSIAFGSGGNYAKGALPKGFLERGFKGKFLTSDRGFINGSELRKERLQNQDALLRNLPKTEASEPSQTETNLPPKRNRRFENQSFANEPRA